MSGKRVRIPFLPLTFSREYMGEPGELMIDLDNERLYIKSLNGLDNIKIVNDDNIIPEIELAKDKLKGNINTDSDTLSKLLLQLNPILDWKRSITESNNTVVDTIDKIFNVFAGMNNSDDNILNILANKVDKVEDGKSYSDNNLTTELLTKLNDIEYGANNYEHPAGKVCNYQPEVISVNGEYNDVVLSKADIPGLETVHPDANYYEHPVTQQCNFTFPIKSVNGRTGNVVITKEDVTLGLVENLRLASVEDILNLDPNAEAKYITPKKLYDTIKYKLFGDALPNDGRVAMKVNLIPDFAKVTFRLRPTTSSARTLVGGDFINWTYGLLYRLYPGTYEYEVSETKDWANVKGTFTIYKDKPFTLDVLLDDLAPFYTTIINVKGPSIDRAYIDEPPYVSPRLMTVENGRAMIKCIPGNTYQYMLMFGKDYPDARGEFIMPGEDNLIIHVGGGTADDEGMADKGDYDDLMKPPATKGKITVSTIPDDAAFTLIGKGKKDVGKKFDIDFKYKYTYICTLDGYEAEEGEVYLEPWEESKNIKIEIKKHAGVTVKVFPSTIEGLTVEINVNDTWHSFERGKVFSNYTHYYYRDKHDGSIMDEYITYEITNIPEGTYNYRVRSKNVPIFEGSMDITKSSNTVKEVKFDSIVNNRYYEIVPEITSDVKDYIVYYSIGGEEIIYKKGDIIRLFHEYKTIDILILIYSTGAEFKYSIDFKNHANTHGGIVKLPIDVKSKVEPGDGTNPNDPTLPEPPEEEGPIDPNKQYGNLYVHIKPEDSILKINGKTGKDEEKDGKPCKVFILEYDIEHTCVLSKTGYQTFEGTVVKNRDTTGIDYTLELFELGSCVFLVNPITVDNVKVQVEVDGVFKEATRSGEQIKDKEYKVYTDGETSTTSEYAIYTMSGIPTGKYPYRVTISGKEVKTGIVDFNSDIGTTTVVNIGTYSGRYYNITFSVSNNDITLPDAKVEVYDNDTWVTVTNEYKLRDDNKSIKYRVKYIGFDLFMDTKSFRDQAIKGGGKVFIPIQLTETDPNQPPGGEAGDSSQLSEDERYMWMNVYPFEGVTIRLGGYIHSYRYQCGTWNGMPKYCDATDYYTSYTLENKVVDIDGIRCYQNIFKVFSLNPRNSNYKFNKSYQPHIDSKWFTVTVSKPGYETMVIPMSWGMVENKGVHLSVVLRKLIDVKFLVNPVTIDGVTIQVYGKDSNGVDFTSSLTKTNTDLGPGNGEYTSSLKDNQFNEYTKVGNPYGAQLPEGTYNYKVMLGSEVLADESILIDKTPAKTIRLGSHSDRYYYIEFNVVSTSGVSLPKAYLYIHNRDAQRWDNKYGTRYYRFGGLQKTITYSIILEGFITETRTINLHGNAIHGGCRFRETIVLKAGNSRPPELPEVEEYEPGDDDELIISMMYLRLYVEPLYGLKINGVMMNEQTITELINISGVKGRIIFIPGVGKAKEFYIARDRQSTLQLNLGPDYKVINEVFNTNKMNTDRFDKRNCSYEEVYKIKLDKLFIFKVQVKPYTLDNVSVSFESEKEPKVIHALTRSEKDSNFMVPELYQYQTFISTPIPDGNYRATVKIGLASVVDSYYDKLVRGIDLESHAMRYREYRIFVRSNSNSSLYLDASVIVMNTDIPIQGVKKVGADGIPYYMVRVYGNVAKNKMIINCVGYRPIEESEYNYTGDAIHAGGVVYKYYYLSKYSTGNQFQVAFYPYLADKIRINQKIMPKDKWTDLPLNEVDDTIPIQEETVSVRYNGFTKYNNSDTWSPVVLKKDKILGHFVQFSVGTNTMMLKRGQPTTFNDEGAYRVDIMYVLHEEGYYEAADKKIEWNSRYNILVDAGSDPNKPARKVRVLVPKPANVQYYFTISGYNSTNYVRTTRVEMAITTMWVNNYPDL